MSPELLLACRLCLRFGVQDPERWLNEIPERIWQLWVEFFNAEPQEFGFEKTKESVPVEKQIDQAMQVLGFPSKDVPHWPPR